MGAKVTQTGPLKVLSLLFRLFLLWGVFIFTFSHNTGPFGEAFYITFTLLSVSGTLCRGSWICLTFPSLCPLLMTSTMIPASAPVTSTFLMTWTSGWCTVACWSQKSTLITHSTSPLQRWRTSMWGLPLASTKRVTACCGPARPARERQHTQTEGKPQQWEKGNDSVR